MMPSSKLLSPFSSSSFGRCIFRTGTRRTRQQLIVASSLHYYNKSHGHDGVGAVDRRNNFAASTKRSASSSSSSTIELDRVCELASSNLRFGPGSTDEIGQDMRDHFRCDHAVIFTDRVVRRLPCMDVVLRSLERNGVTYAIYDDVRVEPDDISFKRASSFLRDHANKLRRRNIGHGDDDDGGGGEVPPLGVAGGGGGRRGAGHHDFAVIALGGGSVIDTAKAANLYAGNPEADFYDFVNPPTGKGLPVPADTLRPLVAIPTTAGTGSETTGVAIFDDTSTKSKTGIASRQLKPSLGIIDPRNTATLPPAVATYTGLDVLCHAVESYTALPFHRRPKPPSPSHRPAYQGSNPISDVWSLYALDSCARNLPLAAEAAAAASAAASDTGADGEERELSRANMLLASAAAGMGFGNAGVHLCHGMSYPVSSQVRGYAPDPGTGYDSVDHPLVPHGLSVIVNAPAVFSFTGVADPDRHATCAKILAEARGDTTDRSSSSSSSSNSDYAGRWLADEILLLCHALDVPMGLRNLGYGDDDIPDLVDGTIQQHRVTKISPRPVHRADLEDLFRRAMDTQY